VSMRPVGRHLSRALPLVYRLHSDSGKLQPQSTLQFRLLTRTLLNAQTQKNKGFAFIRYATVEQAKRACTELKNPQVL
jgi:RNA recognition motif-containing protein